jgi:RND family efflux transporter MFP subunit
METPMACSRSRRVLVLVLGLAAAGCGTGPPALPPPEPPTVAVVKPVVTPLRATKEFTGRLVTKDPVKVAPQVTGRLLTREFKDGDLVEEGKTVLFRIDPVLYDADVKKAKADIAKARADIANWTAQGDRDQAELNRLTKAGTAAAGIEIDKAAANVKVDEAQAAVARANQAAAEAALMKAEENLKYCTILAPATGRVGQALAAPGALVDAYKTDLVSVYPITPVYAVWDVDEQTSLWYRDQIRAGNFGDPRDPATPITCTIRLKNETEFPTDATDRSRHAVVDYVAPELVRGTATRTLRATFENVPKKGPNGATLPPLLSAGDSVRVRMVAGAARPVLTVPESAVFSQQRKQYVYVVADGKAQLREVEPGQTLDGRVEVNRRTSAAGTTGLDESDVVIVDNLLRVRPGIPVTVK